MGAEGVDNVMTKEEMVSTGEIRGGFSAAMSDTYRREVPAYGAIVELVDDVNREAVVAAPELRERYQGYACARLRRAATLPSAW